MIAIGLEHAGATAPLATPSPLSGEWDIQLVTRTGAPPLRFSGRLTSLHSLEMDTTAGYIKLWQMRRGGYILEHSVPTQGAKHTVTLTVSSIEEAAADLEAFCAELLESHLDTVTPESELAPDAITAVFRRQVENSRVRDFLNLSGAALAHWDNWCA